MNSSLVTKHIGVHLGERSILSWTNCCSVADSCLTLCDPMDFHMPDFPVLYCVPEFAQTHVHWVSDAIQSFHPLSSPSPPALNLSQYQGLFQWVSSSWVDKKLANYVVFQAPWYKSILSQTKNDLPLGLFLSMIFFHFCFEMELSRVQLA